MGDLLVYSLSGITQFGDSGLTQSLLRLWAQIDVASQLLSF